MRATLSPDPIPVNAPPRFAVLTLRAHGETVAGSCIARLRMNVLVTGGAGYIGSHMVKLLRGEGWPVVVIDDLSTGHRGAVGDALFVECDAGDTARVAALLSGHRISAVIHFPPSPPPPRAGGGSPPPPRPAPPQPPPPPRRAGGGGGGVCGGSGGAGPAID